MFCVSIAAVLRFATRYIARIDAELLLAHALSVPREYGIAHPEQSVSFFALLRFFFFVYQRQRGYSVAAITHQKECYGLSFFVNKHTLVPRPETEILIEQASMRAATFAEQVSSPLYIDVGTGSGCIPISVLHTLRTQRSALPLQTIAIDISEKALRAAKRNADTHHVSIEFLCGNLLMPILSCHTLFSVKIPLLITANLPYLTEEEWSIEPSIQKEPKQALVADHNGLALYYILLNQIQLLLETYPRPVCCFLEINPDQALPLSEYIMTRFPQAHIVTHMDYSRRARVLQCEFA